MYILQQSNQSADQEIIVLSAFFFFLTEKEATCIMDIRVNVFKYINHLWHRYKLK